MAIGTIATVATIVAAAASLSSMGYAAAQGAPQMPNTASASRQVAEAQASALPAQRAIAAAEQQGGTAVNYGYEQKNMSDLQRQQMQSQIASINKQLSSLPPAPANGPDPSGFMRGPLQKQLSSLQGQLAAIPQGGGTVYIRSSDGAIVPKSEATTNFKGFGTADIEGKLAGQEADIQTALQQKYGPAFAAQALANAEQSDPAGFAARNAELSKIQSEISNPMPTNPMATTLDQQMLERLQAGSGLDDMSKTLLDQAMARANTDRAGNTSSNDVATEMSTGTSGQQRLQAAEGAAGGWLSSGATPADVEYKREQQSLADLGSFVNGQTPESQFRNISGAANGAAPFYPGQQAPSMPSNAATAAPAFTIGAWQQQLRGQQGQANGWLGGLSGLLTATGTLGKIANQPTPGG